MSTTTGSHIRRRMASGWCFCPTKRKSRGIPENKDVMLRLMTLADGKITVLARLFGGQGTINTPSWSPDGTPAGVRRATNCSKAIEAVRGAARRRRGVRRWARECAG